MTKVWEWSRTEGAELLVMLALADHADDDGMCYPGIERIAKKCRISGRSVQRHIKTACELGELQVDENKGATVQGGQTNRYRITVNNCGQPRIQSGDNLSSGDKNTQEVVTNTAGSGDKAVSPKSSVEPSKKRQMLDDEAFWEAMKLTYSYLDIEVQKKKMQAWLLVNPGRQLTQKFIVNWLNKQDKPVNGKITINQNGGSNRNVGHNANLDYSNRPKKTSAEVPRADA